jgi:hypothetical protein
MVAGYTFPATLTDPKLMNLARPAHANPCTTPKKTAQTIALQPIKSIADEKIFTIALLIPNFWVPLQPKIWCRKRNPLACCGLKGNQVRILSRPAAVYSTKLSRNHLASLFTPVWMGRPRDNGMSQKTCQVGHKLL